jgi:hypothetical protein
MHDYIRRPSGSVADAVLDTTWQKEEATKLIKILKERKYLLLPIEAVPELPGGHARGRSKCDGSALSRSCTHRISVAVTLVAGPRNQLSNKTPVGFLRLHHPPPRLATNPQHVVL